MSGERNGLEVRIRTLPGVEQRATVDDLAGQVIFHLGIQHLQKVAQAFERQGVNLLGVSVADGLHLDCQTNVPGDFFSVDCFQWYQIVFREFDGKMAGAVE